LRRPTTRQRRIVVFLLAALTFGIAYYGGNKVSTPDNPPISGVVLQPPMPLPPFALIDQYGDPFSQQRLQGVWSLIAFDPAAGTGASPAFRRLAQVHNRLAQEPDLQRKIRFIYIPKWSETDLGSTATQLGDGFFVLHGEAGGVDQLFDHFGIEQIESDFTLFLADPNLEVQALFTSDLNATTIATDFKSLIQHYR
jgi:hypothetical protein